MTTAVIAGGGDFDRCSPQLGRARPRARRPRRELGVQRRLFLPPRQAPVSYTHLRAHETRSNL
eukprot:4300534-Lingulodinium_polyedra.AAC.1